MSENLTIVPVTLDSIPSSPANEATTLDQQPQPLFIIRKGKAEASFYPGTDEQIIRLVMKELRFL